jgi:hypothetical protein
MGFTNEFLKIPWPSGMLERRSFSQDWPKHNKDIR